MSTPVIPLKNITTNRAGDNVVMVRLLALCPMLAVSVSTTAAATLGTLTLLVMAFSGVTVSLLRHSLPAGVRLPIFLIIVAVLVAIVDMSTEALAPEMHRRLGIFLPLIVTNCAVLARLESFASKQPPLAALIDGVNSGASLLVAIVVLAVAREWLGTGGLAPIIDASNAPLPSALLPAGGFMLFGLMLAAARKCGLNTAP